MRDNYVKSKRIDATIAAIQRREFIVYTYAANYYKYDRNAVSRRIKELIKSRKKVFSF
jgi:hypothetical protein